MPEINPLAVIAECIEKAKATTDPELISDYITKALGILQIDNTEDDAFHMLGSAIVDAAADDEEHSAVCSRSGPSWRSSGSCRNGLQVQRIAVALDHGSVRRSVGYPQHAENRDVCPQSDLLPLGASNQNRPFQSPDRTRRRQERRGFDRTAC
jgi:hypothetical protein